MATAREMPHVRQRLGSPKILESLLDPLRSHCPVLLSQFLLTRTCLGKVRGVEEDLQRDLPPRVLTNLVNKTIPRGRPIIVVTAAPARLLCVNR